ncbi:sensor histidine kinase [candidate division KSB1 bacterium]
MINNTSKMDDQNLTASSPGDLSSLLCSIIRCANLGISKNAFLREVSFSIMDFLRCDAVILQLFDYGKVYTFEAVRPKRPPHKILEDYYLSNKTTDIDLKPGEFLDQEILNSLLTDNNYNLSGINFSKKGSFFTKNHKGLYEIKIKKKNKKIVCNYRPERGYRSVVLIPMKVKDDFVGLLQLKTQAAGFCTDERIELYETIAETVGSAALDRNRQLALRERVKELGCLYGISKIIERSDFSTHEIFESIVNLLPPSWLYPDITAARILLDDNSFATVRFKDTTQKLSSDIIVEGIKRGVVEVVYLDEMPEIYEGPFLLEERKLIDAIALQLSQYIKRKSDEDEKAILHEQIQHADRLATVGQLAAGVAHELNEPLANILGFAQILLDETKLPGQAEQDIKKIEKASLHAREIVKKLLLFSRQMPQKKTLININEDIENAFFFFESRCIKEGIEVIKKLEPDIPDFYMDSSQLQQVVTNLVVNAIQAMSPGDTITLSTYSNNKNIYLIVEDTGIGMSEEVKKQLFVPFFTTKDVSQGTGLGLPVVHGIVKSHGGTISVKSEEGKGARFEIILPIDTNI